MPRPRVRPRAARRRLPLCCVRQKVSLCPSPAAASEVAACDCRCVSPLRADHNELSMPSSCELEFDDPDDLLNFRMIMRPTEVRRG